MNICDRDDQETLFNYFSGTFGDPIEIAIGTIEVVKETRDGERFAELLNTARRLIAKERFLHWQVAFPGVWSAWDHAGLHGGFRRRDRESAMGPDEARAGPSGSKRGAVRSPWPRARLTGNA